MISFTVGTNKSCWTDLQLLLKWLQYEINRSLIFIQDLRETSAHTLHSICNVLLSQLFTWLNRRMQVHCLNYGSPHTNTLQYSIPSLLRASCIAATLHRRFLSTLRHLITAIFRKSGSQTISAWRLFKKHLIWNSQFVQCPSFPLMLKQNNERYEMHISAKRGVGLESTGKKNTKSACNNACVLDNKRAAFRQPGPDFMTACYHGCLHALK